MRRREFIALVGGTAVAWPLAARAQQTDSLRRVGILEPITKDRPGAQERYTAFLEAFEQLGWTPGRNVEIEARWGGGDEAAIRKRNSLRLPRTYLSRVAAPLQTCC
jgi:putative tryptophan/tyrosine transport system substrate-binding protein